MNDEATTSALFRQTYAELRRLAQHRLGRERPDHTLQATALVHEVYLRLADTDVTWRDRNHFLQTAARAMRRVLVDWARNRGFAKRGGGRRRVALSETHVLDLPRAPEILDLDAAITALSRFDRRKARLVELRLFAGLTIDECAPVLEISTATVSREWRSARAWLAQSLAESGSQPKASER